MLHVPTDWACTGAAAEEIGVEVLDLSPVDFPERTSESFVSAQIWGCTAFAAMLESNWIKSCLLNASARLVDPLDDSILSAHDLNDTACHW